MRVELIQFTESDLLEQFEADHFDFAIGGLRDTLERAATMHRTKPYLVAHLALIVRDHNRRKWNTLQEMQDMGDKLTMAVVAGSYHASRFRPYLPEAKLVVLSSEAEFFERSDADALVTSAEGGSAWTLLHPEYGVALPIRPPPEFHYILPVAGYDRVLADYLDRWIDVSDNDGTLDVVFSYWIRGETGSRASRRWSIGRNVLGWWD
jgi:ABC-type amino acid transport substrate-binding protein